jgi:protein O-GlcNAc transferase
MPEQAQSTDPIGATTAAPDKQSERFVAASRHLLAGRLKQAEAACRDLIKDYPDSAEACRLLGDVLQRTGRAEAAVALFEKAIRLNPNFADTHLGLGNALYQLRQYEAAAECFRRALALRPSFFEASHNLASTLRAQGKNDEAVAQFERTCELAPNWPVVYSNFGSLLMALGRREEAAARFRRALELKPDMVEALTNLGSVLGDLGKVEDAEACFRRAITLRPAFSVPYNNLASLLQAHGRHKEAMTWYERGIKINPKMAELHNNLGNSLKDLGRVQQAEASFRRALELKPDMAAAHSNLGGVLQDQGKFEAARAAYRKALAIEPSFVAAHSNLGNVVRELGRLQEAEEEFRRALALRPDSPETLNNLGTVLKDTGRQAEAQAALREALALRPSFVVAHHNLLMTMQYDPATSPAALLAEHRAFDQRFAAPLAPKLIDHRNNRDPERRLRIGYVSGDFGAHPVGYFLTPVLPAHDRSQVEVFGYSDRLNEDKTTWLLQAACDQWRRIVELDDAALAERIRADGIDILVDLSGHTAENRLLVFARKPAPVQVTWAGYVGTTGLSAMDYLISDERETPPGCETECVETVIRLPDGYVCYAPPPYAPDVNRLPASEPGHVTFGCFNNLAKINRSVIALWARILQRLPEAQLIMKTHQLDDGGTRQRFAEQFAGHGVDPKRVSLLGRSKHYALLQEYNRIDIALDPFPYSGGLTTLESLWMGVPVVTKQGDRFAARHTSSHLAAVGLSELIAPDPDGYLKIACELAEDLPRLGALRQGLRARMAASPLCDGPRFTRDLEAAYRTMWRRWCANRGR